MPAYFFDRETGLASGRELKVGYLVPDVSAGLAADLKKHYDARAGLKRLQRPVLIVHGHQDPRGEKNAEEIHALIAGSKLVYLHRCGHFPWIEQPDAFRKAIADFLPAPAR